MKFVPDFCRTLPSEADYASFLAEAQRLLEPCTETGRWRASDGCALHFRLSRAKDARACVVLIHGFTEFSEKLTELRLLLLRNGYDVLCYDARGHGLSDRACESTELAHIDRFGQYADDLDRLLREIVAPLGLPVYLWGHSMGGAVAALSLERGVSEIEKAVLSSPMLCPTTHGVPRGLLRAIVRAGEKRHGADAPVWFMHGFDPNADFHRAGDTSYARFRHNLDLRIAEPRYRSSVASNRWMAEALSVQDAILAKGAPERVRAKVLLLSAENDSVVRIRPQKRLAKRLKNCRFVPLAGAKHCLYTSAQPILGQYAALLLDFFG